MKHSYLSVTFRKGRPIAAYFYLPREDGDTSSRTETSDAGLVVDFTADGRAIGIEITSPTLFAVDTWNELLAELGHGPVDAKVLAPLLAT